MIVGSAFAQKEKGLGLQTEAGLALNRTQSELTWQVQLSPGYHLNKETFLGVGAAYHKYVNMIKDKSFTCIPIYVHEMVTPFKSKTLNPFVSLKVGYGLISKSNEYVDPAVTTTIKTTGGRFFSPSIGLLVKMANANAMLLSASCEFQNISKETTIAGWFINGYGIASSTEKSSTMTFSLNIGWSF